MGRFQSLQKLEKYPGFFINPASQKIYWRGTIKGQAIKKATGTTKITEAKRIIEEYLLSLTSDNFEKALREKKGITNPKVSDLWDEMIKEREALKSKSTMVGYSVSWRRKISPYWGEKNLSDVSPKTIVEFENWFLKEFPGQVFFNTGKHFQMLLNYLHREGYVPKRLTVKDIDKELGTTRKKKKPYRVYTSEEETALISKASTDWAKVLLILYFDTGMRKMEAISRQWEDMNFKDGTLCVWSMKNKKWREIPMTSRVEAALKAHRASSESTYLFPMATDPGRHLASQVFDKEWVRTKRAAEVKGKARVHDIRHSYATRTARDGWPIPIACQALDMSAKEYMKTYVHINPKDIHAWVQKTFERS